MKSGLQALGQINVLRYLYKIHYLLLPVWQRHCWHWLLLAAYLNKGHYDVVVRVATSRSSLPWGPRSRATSWTFSPTSIFHRSPPHLAVTFLHFCLKPEITFDTKSSLHEHLHRVFCIIVSCNSQRRLGGFKGVQLWSHKSTFEIYLKSQMLNLFEMSNILTEHSVQ